MKVFTIGTDTKIFEEGSAVRARVVQYAELFDELHIVVFSKKSRVAGSRIQIASNCFAYPTNSWSRWLYVFGAISIGNSIVRTGEDWVVDSQDPFECGLVALSVSKHFKLPLHIQIHTDFLSPYFKAGSILNRIRVLIALRVLPKANGIRVVSQRIKDSLCRDLRFMTHDSKIAVLPIFSDLGKFSIARPSFDLRQKYPQWNFIILVVGRLSAEKNIGLSISILRKLLKTYPKIGLVIVGSGPLKRRLAWRVWSLGLSKHVAFEKWQDDIVSYYKTAHLFLQTSLYEGFGLALLEAVASGLPAVSSDVGIAPELLNHKGHSFVCPVNDLACFTRAISELIENNQLRMFFSTQIAPDATASFSQTKTEYLALYQSSIQTARKAFLR